MSIPPIQEHDIYFHLLVPSIVQVFDTLGHIDLDAIINGIAFLISLSGRSLLV